MLVRRSSLHVRRTTPAALVSPLAVAWRTVLADGFAIEQGSVPPRLLRLIEALNDVVERTSSRR